MGSRTVVLSNSSETNVLRVGTYQLKLHGRNKLLLHDSLYTPGVQRSLVSFVSLMRIGFSFSFHPNGYLFYNVNFFGHATLNGDFIILDFGW